MSVIQIVKQRPTQKGMVQSWVLCKQKVTSVPKLFKHIDKLLGTFQESELYNLFYTVAHIRENDSTRTLQSQEIIPFDVDDVEEENVEDYIKVFEGVLGVTREEMGIIYSGNGLQFLVLIDTPIVEKNYFNKRRDVYKKVCEILEAELKSIDLVGHVDHSVFSHARVMRVPNTLNIKKGKEKQARLLYSNFRPVRNFLEVEVPTLPEENNKIQYIYDATAIQKECGFLRWMKVNQNRQSEPQWYAMLSVLGRVDRDLAHKYSEDYDEYDFDQTEKKIEQALAAAGPASCHHIRSMYDGCVKCPHFAKIKSPIVLRGYDVPQVQVKMGGTEHTINQEEKSCFRFKTLKGGWGKIDHENLYQDFKKSAGNIIFHDATSRFYKFSTKKSYWQELSENGLAQHAHKKVGPYDRRATKGDKGEFEKFVADETLELDAQYFNKPGVLNFENGFLEMCMETGEVKFTSHSDYYKSHDVKKGHSFTYQYDFEYSEDAECSTWNRFLDEVSLSDQEMINVLQEYVGAALLRVPNAKVAKALILHGTGANGKSVFLEIVEKVIHEKNCFPFGLQDSEDPLKRAELVGKAASIKDESPKKALLESDAFKTLVTGGTTDYRRLYENPKSFQNATKFFIACNDFPFSQDVSTGLLRRMLILPFDLYVPEIKQDKFLKEKLELELPGIINWSIEGAKRFIRQSWRFTPFKRGLEKMMEYKLDTNVIFSFIDEFIELTPDGFLPSKAVWYKFRDHYEQESRRFSSQVSFMSKFKQTVQQTWPEHRFETTRSRTKGVQARGIMGIKFIGEDKEFNLDNSTIF